LEVVVDAGRIEVSARPAALVILLDTNALIWVEQGHRRVRALVSGGSRLHISPASVLELQFLDEAGRIRLARGSVEPIVHDDRWVLDEPPSIAWFERAVDLKWTRDPFDRLLAAHVQIRGWRLATSDTTLLHHLGSAGIAI
jgi:PIN domain nuclease of toxin-antitoxin system